jgi:hypothetical protein
MSELMPYLKDNFGISRTADVTWSHAVNNKAKLDRFINDLGTIFIESDIRRSKSGIPIAAHPPETESDLSFDALIDAMRTTRQGLKIDFKDPEIVVACLTRLKMTPLSQPVLLNADVLRGNGASEPKINAIGFLADCKNYYPSGILSLGWTTTSNLELGYTDQNVDDMLTLCGGIEEVTFPVRACLLPASWNALERLTEKEGYTLSLWNNEPIDIALVQEIRDRTNPKKTFYDFIDENKDPLRLL